MSLLFMDGFDHQSSKGWVPAVSSFATGRNGGSAMQPAVTISFSPSRRVGFTPVSHVFIGAAVLASSGDFGSSSSSSLMLLGDGGATIHLTVNYSATGALQLRRGDGGGAVIATSTQRVIDSVWHYLEIEATIADAGGIAKVRLNGVEVINFTGDTRNAGTSTNIDGLGCNRSNVGGALMSLDDVYVCDDSGSAPYNTYLGDVTIPFRLANGNGTLSQWVGSDGNSTDNYLLVDETAPNTTDYVASDVLGNRDLVTVQDMTSTTGSVLAAQTVIYGAKSDAGAANVKMLQRASTGTVVADAVGQPLSTSYATYGGEIRILDPDNTAWTHAKINGLEVGVEVA